VEDYFYELKEAATASVTKLEKPPYFRGLLQSYPKKSVSWIWCILG